MNTAPASARTAPVPAGPDRASPSEQIRPVDVPGAEEHFDLAVLASAVRYQQWLLGCFSGHLGGTVLEIGAGNGNFTRWIARDAKSVTALDPHPDTIDLIDRLDLPNVIAVRDDLAAHVAHGVAYDAAVMINVLEHLNDDVRAVEHLRASLVPGGAACISVPAHPALHGALDVRYGHRRRYRADGLRRVVERGGLELESIRHFNPIGALGWLVTSRLLRRDRIAPGTVLVSERVAVPLGRLIDRVWRMPVGQSLVVVARRPPS